MQTSLTYGRQAVIHFDISDSALLLDRRGPDGEPLDDPAAAVAAALATPANYPALASAVTSDDRVTIALGPGVPQADAVIAGIVYTLAEGDVAEDRITILQTAGEAGRSGRDIMAGLPDHARRRIQLAVHDPADRKSLGYLAADAQGQPIYFNRHLCDADLVIPVGCLRTGDGPGHSGMSVGMYPTFADEAAQRRFAAISSSEDPVHRRRRDEEADQAVWLLGAMFTLQLLPGAGDTVLHVLAGERGAVAAGAGIVRARVELRRAPAGQLGDRHSRRGERAAIVGKLRPCLARRLASGCRRWSDCRLHGIGRPPRPSLAAAGRRGRREPA